MKEGIAIAIGKMERTEAEASGKMKVEIATAIGEMKTSVAETKWEIIKWILGGVTTLITLALVVSDFLTSDLYKSEVGLT